MVHPERLDISNGPLISEWRRIAAALTHFPEARNTFLNALGYYYLPPLDGQEVPIHPELVPLLEENLRLRSEDPMDSLRRIPGLINRAALHALQGENAQARDRLEEALKISEPPNGAYRVRVQRNLGSVLTELGEHRQAKEVLQEALDTLDANGAEKSEEAAWIRHNLAFNLEQQGDPTAAETHYRRNVHLHREPSANLAELVAASAANLAALTLSAGETLPFAAALVEGNDTAIDKANAVESPEEPTASDKKVRKTQ
jgi:tetratricopeptide (TPR) repeat protein